MLSNSKLTESNQEHLSSTNVDGKNDLTDGSKCSELNLDRYSGTKLNSIWNQTKFNSDP